MGGNIPCSCEQRFLSAVSVEVVRVACLSRSWFVYACKQTNYATDKPRERLRRLQPTETSDRRLRSFSSLKNGEEEEKNSLVNMLRLI